MLLTLDEEGLDEELLLTLEEDLELLEEPTELLLLEDLLGEKEDLELLLVLDGAAEVLLIVLVLAPDLTVREEEGATALLRTDDVDTPLAEVDLTFALLVTVFLRPAFDLVIAPVFLESFTLLAWVNVFAVLLSLALLIVVNP